MKFWQRKNKVSKRQLAAIAGTRALLGLGAGLLLSPRFDNPKRRIIGLALFGVGVASTIPIARSLFAR